jgi:hypothetical protein
VAQTVELHATCVFKAPGQCLLCRQHTCSGSIRLAAALPEDVNAMRTFDVVPVIRLQSNQHRIELPIVIKRLFSQRNSSISKRSGLSD